jgi:histidinol phosphatase-like PHP family hydrolase
MNNLQIAEWLARQADVEDQGSVRSRALRRAARAALLWPVEAGELSGQHLPLTQLHRVGPYVAGVMAQVIDEDNPVEPDPLRRGFLTRSQLGTMLSDTSLSSAVRADFQLHTTWSDGHASVAAMANEAIRLGREYMVVTDHSKGLAIAGGKDEAAFSSQREEIQQENIRFESAQIPFTVLAGIEMNLSPSGEGDMDPAFLSTLDLVLGAFHSKLRLIEDQTDRYLAALRNPTIDVLGHPRGRIFNFRLGLTARWDVVFEEALRHDVALEVDGYPDRQDLDVDQLHLAGEMGVRISLGSDAHAPMDLQYLEFAIAAATHAGISPDRIINTMTIDELHNWTSSRRL